MLCDEQTRNWGSPVATFANPVTGGRGFPRPSGLLYAPQSGFEVIPRELAESRVNGSLAG